MILIQKARQRSNFTQLLLQQRIFESIICFKNLRMTPTKVPNLVMPLLEDLSKACCIVLKNNQASDFPKSVSTKADECLLWAELCRSIIGNFDYGFVKRLNQKWFRDCKLRSMVKNQLMLSVVIKINIPLLVYSNLCIVIDVLI